MRLLVLALLLAAGAPVAADTIVVEAERDATIIEDPDGAIANGSGPVFFAGRNSQPVNSIRRGLVRFDLAGLLPPGAIVEEAWLELHALPGNPPPREIRLHRVLAFWDEGPSSSSGGGGAPSQIGDVTWIHTVYDGEFWVIPGGHYVAHPSASTAVADTGAYTWGGPGAVARDVNLWARSPRTNHGWIVTGDESIGQTAKVFASREGSDASQRPRLRITYRPAGEGSAP